MVLQSEKFDKQVASRDLSNYKVVKRGQLVYSFPIDEGVIAILHRHPVGAVSPAYHVWDITREVDLTFLDMMLKTPALINYYKMHSSNVVHRRRNLSPKDFVNVPIPLPPLPEQRAIAHVLTTVREAIEATDRVLIAARELKRSLMHHLFTYGPVPVNEADQVALKETEIGEVPEGWNSGTLGDFFTLQRGYDLPQRERHDGTIPVISSAGVFAYHNEAKAIAPGVVTGRYGSIGKIHYIEEDYWPLNTTLFVKDFKGNDPLFISYLLTRINFDDFNDKTSVPGINRNHIHSIKAAIPETK
ncbi:MAG TPA: restriction endonuclease subunit S, partial [Anaerolineales bacterium]|nr:restriction endonuclease subunit S [Anaerolineales bacterium]